MDYIQSDSNKIACSQRYLQHIANLDRGLENSKMMLQIARESVIKVTASYNEILGSSTSFSKDKIPLGLIRIEEETEKLRKTCDEYTELKSDFFATFQEFKQKYRFRPNGERSYPRVLILKYFSGLTEVEVLERLDCSFGHFKAKLLPTALIVFYPYIPSNYINNKKDCW